MMLNFKPSNFVNSFLKESKLELKVWMLCFLECSSKDPLMLELEYVASVNKNNSESEMKGK